MKIESVRSFLLSFPFPEPIRLPFYGGERTIVKRDAMFIRIEADNGLVGYAPGPGSEQAQQAIEQTIAPFLEGRSLADPDALRVKFMEGPGTDLSLAKIYCAVEIALYDLTGKAVGAPVSELLGGRSYSLETVEQLAREMARHHIAWLEEPMPPDDHASYLKLKEKDIVPLASGEHEPTEERYLDLILSQAVDYVQMDVCCQGGYSLGRRVFAEIARQGLRFAFHSWGTALEVIAAAQLGICWPQMVVEWLEYPCYSSAARAGMYPFPLAAEILTEPLQIERGDLIVPRAPGLGVTVDERVIERYPWIPGPWSLFRTDSPPETRAVTSDHSVQWDTGIK